MSSNQHSQQEYIDVVVYYAYGGGVLLKVSDGQNRPASYLFDLVLDELEVDAQLHPTIREVFSLWLVSDLLELQLKPNHIPFKLVCYWEELLEKYTSAPEGIQQRDEPILVFRRNVFADVAEEAEIEDETLLGLLFDECRGNVVRGRYGGMRGGKSDGRHGVDEAMGGQLAAIQAAILLVRNQKEGKSVEALGSTAYFKSNLKYYLPVALCKRNLIFNRESNPEVVIANNYRELTSRDDLSLTNLYRQYLDICRNFFFYASGFFVGQAEHPGKKVDDPVLIAVNHNGVSIIDLDDQVWLLSLPYDKLRWQFAKSNSTDPDSLPCIFFHWKAPQSDEFKLLQIFTKSALLVDNLIEAFVELKQQQPQLSDGGNGGGGIVEFGDCELSHQFQRLVFVTYDQQGKRISSAAKMKSKNINEIA